MSDKEGERKAGGRGRENERDLAFSFVFFFFFFGRDSAQVTLAAIDLFI